jgi:hypothetical protein
MVPLALGLWVWNRKDPVTCWRKGSNFTRDEGIRSKMTNTHQEVKYGTRSDAVLCLVFWFLDIFSSQLWPITSLLLLFPQLSEIGTNILKWEDLASKLGPIAGREGSGFWCLRFGPLGFSCKNSCQTTTLKSLDRLPCVSKQKQTKQK